MAGATQRLDNVAATDERNGVPVGSDFGVDLAVEVGGGDEDAEVAVSESGD